MNIRIEVDMSDLELDIDKVESAIEKELAVTGYKIEGTAKELAPVKYLQGYTEMYSKNSVNSVKAKLKNCIKNF